MTVERVGLFAPALELPERVVSSDELADRFVDKDGERVFSGRILRRLTGVSERRYAAPGTCSSDLAAAAGAKALAGAGLAPEAIDLVIFAAASHDLAEPATANRVQHLLGCTNARVMDVKNACNSFLDGLDVARSMIIAGSVERVLLVNGEVISPFVALAVEPPRTPAELVAGLTLGDAGAAAVVAPWSPAALASVGPGAFRTLGQHWDASRILGGGSMAGRDGGEDYFVSDSGRLFGLAAEHVPLVIAAALAERGWTIDDLDLVVPHQASAAITRRICEETGVPLDRCVLVGAELGNMAAASIPVALCIALAAGRVTPGAKLLLVGGAAGFSAAALPLVVNGARPPAGGPEPGVVLWDGVGAEVGGR